jgi:thymidine phosphorylase
MEVVYELGAKLLLQAGVAGNKDEAIQKQQSLIDAGKARDLFENMVVIQGGDLSGLETAIRPKYEKTIVSESNGIITSMDTEAIGWGLVELGCGRKRPNENLDHSAGMEVIKKVGDEILKGEPVFRVFNSSSTRLDSALRLLKNTVKTDGDLVLPPLILGDL